MSGCRCEGERILMYIPVSGPSNLVLYTPLGQELVRRGHQVTMVTSIAQPPQDGMTNILVSTAMFSSFRDDLSAFLVSESKASIWESFERANHFYRAMLQVRGGTSSQSQLLCRFTLMPLITRT